MVFKLQKFLEILSRYFCCFKLICCTNEVLLDLTSVRFSSRLYTSCYQVATFAGHLLVGWSFTPSGRFIRRGAYVQYSGTFKTAFPCFCIFWSWLDIIGLVCTFFFLIFLENAALLLPCFVCCFWIIWCHSNLFAFINYFIFFLPEGPKDFFHNL